MLAAKLLFLAGMAVLASVTLILTLARIGRMDVPPRGLGTFTGWWRF